MQKTTLGINLHDIPVTVKIVKLINEHRPSLELPTMYSINSKISAIINGLGRGVSYVGEKAMGKGEIIKMTKRIFQNFPKELKKKYLSIEVDKFTSAFFVKMCKDMKADYYDWELILEDMSTTIDTKYLALQCYDTVSKLIGDKIVGIGTADIFAHDTGVEVKKESDITAIVNSFQASLGMTNLILRKIKKFDGYNSMWKDRITEFYPILTAKEKERIDELFNFNPDNPRTPASEIRNQILNILPSTITPKGLLPLSKDIKENYEIYKLVYLTLYKYQHTVNRGTTYFNGDLSANALINGRQEINRTDISFYNLFMPNLYLSKFPSSVQRVTQNVLWCPDLYELADNFNYSPKYITEGINRIPDVSNILEYEGDTVNMTENMREKIKEQQDFISACLRF